MTSYCQVCQRLFSVPHTHEHVDTTMTTRRVSSTTRPRRTRSASSDDDARRDATRLSYPRAASASPLPPPLLSPSPPLLSSHATDTTRASAHAAQPHLQPHVCSSSSSSVRSDDASAHDRAAAATRREGSEASVALQTLLAQLRASARAQRGRPPASRRASPPAHDRRSDHKRDDCTDAAATTTTTTAATLQQRACGVSCTVAPATTTPHTARVSTSTSSPSCTSSLLLRVEPPATDHAQQQQQQQQQQHEQHEQQEASLSVAMRMDELRTDVVELCAALREDVRALLATQQQQQQQQQRERDRNSTTLTCDMLLRALAAASPSQRAQVATLLLASTSSPQQQQQQQQQAAAAEAAMLQMRSAVQTCVHDTLHTTLKAHRHGLRAWVQRRCASVEQRVRREVVADRLAHAQQASAHNDNDNNNDKDDDATRLCVSADELATHVRAAVRAAFANGTAHKQMHVKDDDNNGHKATQQQQRDAWTRALAEQARATHAQLQSALAHERQQRHVELQRPLAPLTARLAAQQQQQQQQQEQSTTASCAQCRDARDRAAAAERRCHALEQQLHTLAAQVHELQQGATLTVAATTTANGKASYIDDSDRNGSSSSGAGKTSSLAFCAADYASAATVQSEVVQPALQYVRRLMAAHQSMLDTLVQQRCARVEAALEQASSQCDGRVADVRTRVAALRRDVRLALADMCQALDVAAPTL